jgi:hypothetical protein
MKALVSGCNGRFATSQHTNNDWEPHKINKSIGRIYSILAIRIYTEIDVKTCYGTRKICAHALLGFIIPLKQSVIRIRGVVLMVY